MKIFLRVKVYALLVVLCLLFMLSCKNEIVPTEQSPEAAISVKNGRLVFKTGEDLNATLAELGKYSNWSQLKGFETKYKFTSLHKSNELTNERLDMPMMFQAILNSDSEYMVGTTIVWFGKDYTYMINNADEKLLQTVKNNPSAYKNKYPIYLKTLKTLSSDDGKRVNNVNLPTGGFIDARYQKGWIRNGDGDVTRKNVFEVQSFSYNTYSGYNNGVKLRIKLEYWRNGWQPNCRDPRVTYFNIYGQFRANTDNDQTHGTTRTFQMDNNYVAPGYYYGYDPDTQTGQPSYNQITQYDDEPIIAVEVTGATPVSSFDIQISGKIFMRTYLDYDCTIPQTDSEYRVDGYLW